MNEKVKTNDKLQLCNVDTNKKDRIQVKWNSKYKNLDKRRIMYNLKDKLSTV